jgi:hypothetical protein
MLLEVDETSGCCYRGRTDQVVHYTSDLHLALVLHSREDLEEDANSNQSESSSFPF